MLLLAQATSTTTGIPKDFFTPTSLATLAGATGAVYVVCGTIQRVFNYNPKWLALLVSILVSYIAAFITVSDGNDAIKYIIAFFNGCLIYITATGSNTMFGSAPGGGGPKPTGVTPAIIPNRTFNTRWWSN